MVEYQIGLPEGKIMTLADQISALVEARKGLAMWHMDTSGIDAVLKQHGVNLDEL